MPDIREEFEAYIAGVRERVEARGFEPLGDAIEKWMLHAWQASRAAQRVELPRPLQYGEGATPYVDGWNTGLHFASEKLREQGIEVTPCTSQ